MFGIRGLVFPLPLRSPMESLFSQLLQRRSRHVVEAICQIVGLLVDHGAEIPFKPIKEIFGPLEGNEDLGLLMSESDYDRHPIAIAMMVHCPPSLLELVLKSKAKAADDDSDEVHALRASVDPSSAGPLKTDLGFLVRSLHCHFFMPKGDWMEAYNGEVGDSLRKKVELLVKYGAVTSIEETVLRGLVCAVRKVYSFEDRKLTRNGFPCWLQLFKAICSTDLPDPDVVDGSHLRGHAFYVSKAPRWCGPLCQPGAGPSTGAWNYGLEYFFFGKWLRFWETSSNGQVEAVRQQFWNLMSCKADECTIHLTHPDKAKRLEAELRELEQNLEYQEKW